MEKKEYRILVLYAEVVGYVMTLFNTIANNYPVTISIVQWDNQKLSKFESKPFEGERISIHNKSSIDLQEHSKTFAPNIILVSGWMDNDYLKICRKYKGLVPIVAMSDTKWMGTIKQRLFSYFPLNLFLKLHFDYFWVTGTRQITFARNMGYSDEKVIPNLFSADTLLFNESFEANFLNKQSSYPHVLLYVGRISYEKGCSLLIDSFEEVQQELNSNWKLVLVGNKMEANKSSSTSVIFKDYMSKEELAEQVKNAGVFCMPSHREQWGVAIHEFATAGLPMINSKVCGANSMFLIEGFNGFSFEASSKEDLKLKIKKIICSSDLELNEMSINSNLLGNRITPEISAASLMSIFYS